MRTSFLTSLSLLGLATAQNLWNIKIGARWKHIPCREKYFPNEPCFDPEKHCFHPYRWNKREEDSANNDSPDSINATLTFVDAFSCETLAGNDEDTYQQCLAVTQDPSLLHELIIPGSISPRSPKHKSHSEPELTTHCCIMPADCHHYMSTHTRDKPYYPEETEPYEIGLCCLGLWALSCGGQPQKYPVKFYAPPRCSNPEGWL